MSERNSPARGAAVLREAVVLLSEMTFDATMGDTARGAWVSVFIVPQRAEGETITVDISCRPAWPQTVDWDKLALWVRPAPPAGSDIAVGRSDRSASLLPPLDERGFVSFSGLPARLYSISVGERAARGLLVEAARGDSSTGRNVKRRAVRTRGGVATGSSRVRGALASAEDAGLRERVRRRRTREGQGSDTLFPISGLKAYPSLHRRITATVLPGVEAMEVAFETDDEAVARRRVRFFFLDVATGRVALTGEVAFRSVPDVAHLWEAVWLGPLLTATADFVYELF